MNAFTFVFGLLPWWSWLAVVAFIGICFIPGVLPVVLGLVKLVPRDVWIVLGLGIAAVMWVRGHDELLVERITTKVTAERDKFWRDREDAANKAAAQREAALQLRLDTSLASAREASAAHAQQLSAERLKRHAAEAELDRQRSVNVTPEADRDCVLTAGIVRQFNVAASVANGYEDADGGSAPGAGPVDVNAPSGVPVSALSGAIDAAGKAFGECRARVAAWERYHATVIAPWITSTVQSLQSCVP